MKIKVLLSCLGFMLAFTVVKATGDNSAKAIDYTSVSGEENMAPSTSSCTFALTIKSTPYYCVAAQGTATAVAAGGHAPYTYLWAPGGQTTSNITGLSTGTYSVVVTDNAGCTASSTVTIATGTITVTAKANPPGITLGDSSQIIATCNIPATYAWMPSATVRHPNADTTYAYPTVTTMYTVTATTACGTVSDSVLVTLNCFALSMSSTPYYCSSSYQGSATVTPLGGTPPYTYKWTPSNKTTATISGLPPGTYTVMVLDSTGCASFGTVKVIVGTPVITATATPSHINAGDSTLLSATNSFPSTYQWQPSAYCTHPNQQTTYAHPPVTTVFTVIAITDTCTITSVTTDTVWVNGCSLNLALSTTPYSCSSYLGSATITASGGTLPYTYLWAPGGQTTATITGLTAGGYTVTVTDSAGCKATKAVTISSVPVTYSAKGNPLWITLGDSTLLTSSCSVPATYSWAPPATVRNPNKDSTYASPTTTTIYTVTITTACGIYTDTIQINLNCFNIALTSTTAYNCSSYNGSATVTPSGGTPPYTYKWMPSGKTTATITGLPPGTYTVTVFDSTGCSSMGTVSVSSAAVSLTVSAFPPIITLGDSSYLSASMPVPASYTWAPAAGLSCTTCANPWATPTVTTVYTVTAITACGTYHGYDTVTVATCTNNFNEPICIVTVDTANNHPAIIWGRTNSPPLTGSYTVYKENSSFVFMPIDNQPLNVLSDYIDTSSNPSLGPISYKLATDDSCGESALSPVHTTIYLTVTNGTNVNILNWTAYVGFVPSVYRIYRGPSMGALVKIDSVPSTILTYHDTLPPIGQIYLVQAVNPTSACIPSLTIKHHGFSAKIRLEGSLSNGYDTRVTGINSVVPEQVNLNIYPNPNNGMFTIESPIDGHWSVVVYNELGQIVYIKKGVGEIHEQLNLENISTGIYSLKLQTTNGIAVKKLVKIK